MKRCRTSLSERSGGQNAKSGALEDRQCDVVRLLLPRRFLIRQPRVDAVVGIVADLPGHAVVQVHLALFLGVQGPRADPAEDADLVAALVDGAVAVDALRRSPGRGRPAAA